MSKHTAPTLGASLPEVEDWPRRCAATLLALRAGRPRVHAMTNPVAQLLTANGLLALGAIPTLTTNPEEAADFVAASAATLLNLGMLDAERFAALPRAAEAASRLGKPFVIDPAFADRSPRRKALAVALFASGPTAVKLNPDEAIAFAEALPPGCLRLTTGPVDQLRHGARRLALSNGHALLQSTTATGCLLGAILAACLAVEPDPLVAGATAVSLLNIAAEQAALIAQGPGSFAVGLVDALANLTPDHVMTQLRLVAPQGDPA